MDGCEEEAAWLRQAMGPGALGNWAGEGELADWLRGWGGLGALGPEALAECSGRLADVLRPIVELGRGEALPIRVDGPEAAIRVLGRARARQPVESFWVLSLDARSRVLGLSEVGRGTVSACLVHPREVFRPAIARGATHVVVLHNHPSGRPEPSPEDLALTKRLVEAGHLLGIPLVDHLVVGREGHCSALGKD
ncbi:MAG: JAB domain-containing protein [Myxococcota bacterium]